MIVDRRLSVPRTLYALRRPLLFLQLVTFAEVFAVQRLGLTRLSIPAQPLTVVGAAISIFLVFRTNTVYDRYWEGRTLWGRLVNASRTWARQWDTFLCGPGGGLTPEMEALRRKEVRSMAAFAHALRASLRGLDPVKEAAPYLGEDDARRLTAFKNAPNGLLVMMGEAVGKALGVGLLHPMHAPALDATLTEVTEVQGGCERIKNTPLPPVYTYLAHKAVVAFCYVLPFALVRDLGYWTPVLVFLLSSAFYVLDDISIKLEQPFGTMSDDLPLNTLCRTIEIDMLQAIGESDVPEPLQPVDGVLL